MVWRFKLQESKSSVQGFLKKSGAFATLLKGLVGTFFDLVDIREVK